MIHGAYIIQIYQEDKELKETWRYVEELSGINKIIKRLEEQVMIRWWLVDAWTCIFYEWKTTWNKICKAISNLAPSGSATRKIAFCTLKSMANECIMNDICLLVLFHKVYLFLNIKFLESGDPEVGDTAGFIVRHITVRYYVMLEDIANMEGYGYQTHADFIEYKNGLNNLSNNDKEIQK